MAHDDTEKYNNISQITKHRPLKLQFTSMCVAMCCARVYKEITFVAVLH